MLNTVSLMGRLTKAPELKTTQSGVSVCSITLAVERDFAPQGQAKETDFIDIVAWRQTADFLAKYFDKGQLAAVSGRLQTRTWQDRDGQNRKAVEVIAEHVYFASARSENRGENTAQRQQSVYMDDDNFKDFEELDDDGCLPF